MYFRVRDIKKRYQPRIAFCTDAKGRLIEDKKRVLKR